MKLDIRTKTCLATTLIVATIVTVLAAVLLYQFRDSLQDLRAASGKELTRTLMQQMRRRGQALTRVLAENLANPVYLSDMATTERLLRAVKSESDVLYTLVFDPDGTIIHDGKSKMPSHGDPVPDRRSLEALAPDRGTIVRMESDRLVVTAPVRIGARAIAGVEVALSLDTIRADAQASRTLLDKIQSRGRRRNLIAVVVTALVFLLLGGAVSLAMSRSLLAPVREVAHAATALSRGDTASPISSRRHDELGELVRRFNQMNRSLQETTVSREYVSGIVTSMDDALCIVAADGTIEMANPALHRLLGYKEEEQELLSRPFLQILDGKEGEKLYNSLHDLRADGGTLTQDATYVTKLGKPVAVTLSASVMSLPDRSNNRLVCVAKDITDRLEAEETLQHKVDLLHLISALSTRFINVQSGALDAEIEKALEEIGSFSDADRSYVFLLADDGATMSNSHEWCAKDIPPQKQKLQSLPCSEFPALVRTLEQGNTWHVPDVSALPPSANAEKQILEQQGIRSLLILPLISRGEFVGYLGFDSCRRRRHWSQETVELLRIVGEILVNALNRNRAEKERRRLETQVRDAQKLESLGVLAGGIAHDFNNLLVGIVGNADLIEEDLPQDSVLRECLEDMRKAALSASELTHQMLNYAGKGQLHIGPVKLNDLVRNMTHLLDAAVSKSAVLRYELDPDMPPVKGDASQLRQVIVNLATNASEALGDHSGTIRIRTGTATLENSDLQNVVLGNGLVPGRYAFLEVSDNGTGMDGKTRNRLFDPFFTTKFTGRGMGLASVLGIVRGHSGAIAVESTPDTGSRFRILLPPRKKEKEAPPVQEPSAPEQEPWAGDGYVLVVDDTPAVRRVTGQLLNRLGLECIPACDGVEALRKLDATDEEIVAVLLDMTMPRLNGIQTLEEIRKRSPVLPVILMSGYTQEQVGRDLDTHAPVSFLEKPFSADELSAILRRMVAQTASTPGRTAQ